MRKLSKINETSWGGMVRRSSSEVKRKEDEIPGNIKEIQWVDFGERFNFLVADRFFEIDGETYFYKEHIDMFPVRIHGETIRLFNEDEFDELGLWVDVEEMGDENKISSEGGSIVLPQETIYNQADIKTMLDGTNHIGMFSPFVRSKTVYGRANTKYRVLLIKDK